MPDAAIMPCHILELACCSFVCLCVPCAMLPGRLEEGSCEVAVAVHCSLEDSNSSGSSDEQLMMCSYLGLPQGRPCRTVHSSGIKLAILENALDSVTLLGHA